MGHLPECQAGAAVHPLGGRINGNLLDVRQCFAALANAFHQHGEECDSQNIHLVSLPRKPSFSSQVLKDSFASYREIVCLSGSSRACNHQYLKSILHITITFHAKIKGIRKT